MLSSPRRTGPSGPGEDGTGLGRALSAGWLLVLVALSMMPAASARAQGPDLIAIRATGSAENRSAGPPRLRFTVPASSMTTGRPLGTVTDDIACATSGSVPCLVVDEVTTFQLPAGSIVSHALVSVAPDAQRPGWVILGSRPDADTITSATGAYAGRTGRVLASGAADDSGLPNRLTEDTFWVIQLGP